MANRTRKVVYNDCFGGFSLSTEAVLLGRKLSGDAKWAGAVIKGEMYSDGSGPELNVTSWDAISIHYDFPRHDPILVRVVEELGEKASGTFANLQIETVSGPYRIDEYDGSETVETPDSYEWVE